MNATQEAPAKSRVRKGQNLNVWLPDDLMAAFEKRRQRNRRTITAEVQVFMEESLASTGDWPPPEDG